MPRYKLDSNGKGPDFKKGERVLVLPLKREATVIEQILHWDYPESFYGNVKLMFDDGVEGLSNCWQLSKVGK